MGGIPILNVNKSFSCACQGQSPTIHQPCRVGSSGRRGAQEPIGTKELVSAFDLLMRELGAEFEARLAQAYAPLPRRLLVALGRSHPATKRRKELSEAIGVTTTALSQPLNSLLLEGAIEQPGRGLYQIVDPVFGAWLAELSRQP